uniref:Protein CMSS1 n=1 Tax=Romanomermis culicivorax TaxID=13658 RepID=A0A915KGV2_ROMCU
MPKKDMFNNKVTDLETGLENFVKRRKKCVNPDEDESCFAHAGRSSENDDEFTAESDKMEHSPAKKSRKSFYKVFRDKCSLDEFQKLWDEYISEKLTRVEADHFQLSAEQFVTEALNDDSMNVNIFLKENILEWRSWMKADAADTGAPFVLIVCGSAIRAVNFNRDLTEFKTKFCKCAKLFAKHMKLKDQQKFLNEHSVHLAIGTPQRIIDLISDNSLKLRSLRYLILDWSFSDVKKRRSIDYPYIRDQIFDLIRLKLYDRIKSGDLKCLLV